MSRFMKAGSIAVLVSVVAALSIAAAVSAQGARLGAPATPAAHGGRFGPFSPEALEAAAKVLGMTSDELSTQLWGGKTLAGLADEAGVDLQVVRDAVEAAQLDAVKAAIAQAVADGSITQSQADWLLQGLANGYWGGGHGMGLGFGMGRSRFHSFGAPGSNSTTTDTSGT